MQMNVICITAYFVKFKFQVEVGGSREDENHKNYQQTEIIATTHEISHNTRDSADSWSSTLDTHNCVFRFYEPQHIAQTWFITAV